MIFLGNYVAHLNAYRDQGVYAVPGVEFYQMRGVAIVDSNLTGGGTLALKILSPDLRQTTTRLDKVVILAGATVYRTTISAVNLSASGTDTLAVDGLTTTTNTEATLTAGWCVPEAGATTSFDGFTTVSVEAGGATISVLPGVPNMSMLTTVLSSLRSASMWMAEAPTSDDIHLPYKTEAGQATDL